MYRTHKQPNICISIYPQTSPYLQVQIQTLALITIHARTVERALTEIIFIIVSVQSIMAENGATTVSVLLILFSSLKRLFKVFTHRFFKRSHWLFSISLQSQNWKRGGQNKLKLSTTDFIPVLSLFSISLLITGAKSCVSVWPQRFCSCASKSKVVRHWPRCPSQWNHCFN